MAKILLATLSTLLLSGCSFVGGVFGVRSMYEEPKYETVTVLDGDVHIRRYAPRLAAQVTVDSTANNADRNRAFGYLFDYISGENQSADKVAMTVPVEMDENDGGEKIAMTVPVEMNDADASTGTMTMRFFLPAEYTMETAPVPTNPRVEIVELAPETVAVRTIGGSSGDSRVRSVEQQLLEALEGTNWQPAGKPVAYYYDPPFTLPPFRKTEVVVPVQARVESRE